MKKISSMYNNLGVLYQEARDYTKAIEYYSQALAIAKELKNENSITNINTIYSKTRFSSRRY